MFILRPTRIRKYTHRSLFLVPTMLLSIRWFFTLKSIFVQNGTQIMVDGQVRKVSQSSTMWHNSSKRSRKHNILGENAKSHIVMTKGRGWKKVHRYPVLMSYLPVTPKVTIVDANLFPTALRGVCVYYTAAARPAGNEAAWHSGFTWLPLVTLVACFGTQSIFICTCYLGADSACKCIISGTSTCNPNQNKICNQFSFFFVITRIIKLFSGPLRAMK